MSLRQKLLIGLLLLLGLAVLFVGCNGESSLDFEDEEDILLVAMEPESLDQNRYNPISVEEEEIELIFSQEISNFEILEGLEEYEVEIAKDTVRIKDFKLEQGKEYNLSYYIEGREEVFATNKLILNAVDVAQIEAEEWWSSVNTQWNSGFDYEKWDNEETYHGGDKIEYNDRIWEGQWWTYGDEPGTNVVWQPLYEEGEIPDWEAIVIYTKGDKVLYNGESWQARWWTKGQKPSTNHAWQSVDDEEEQRDERDDSEKDDDNNRDREREIIEESAESWARIDVADNFYLINNNWSTESIRNGDIEQSIYYYDDGSYGWSWERGQTGVEGPNYPEVLVGYKPWGGDPVGTKLLPIQLKDIDSLMMELDVDYEILEDDGAWNLAFELWITMEKPGPNSDASETITDEVMIWFDWKDGLWDWEEPVERNAIDDGYAQYEYNVSKSNWGDSGWIGGNWHYSQFRIHQPGNMPEKVNLKPFIDYIQKELGRSEEAWLGALELGMEYGDETKGSTDIIELNYEINGQRLESGGGISE